jgi:hypothetical protein
MSHRRRAVSLTVAVTAVGLLAAGGVWAGRGGTTPDQPRGPVGLGNTQSVALTTATDCSSLLSHFVTEGTKVVGPYGLEGVPINTFVRDLAVSGQAASGGVQPPVARSESAPDLNAGAAPDSTTNVQVAGVDESDIVKTTGDLMLSAVNGAVRITRMDGGQTRTLATWRPRNAQADSLLVDGTKVVVIGTPTSYAYPGAAIAEDDVAAGGSSTSSTGSAGSGSAGSAGSAIEVAPELSPMPSGLLLTPAVELTLLDITDPGNPTPVRKLEVKGSLSGSARLVDGELRFAVTSQPSGIAWRQPIFKYSADGTMESPQNQQKVLDRATAANRSLIARSRLANWLPQATVTNLDADGRATGPTTKRPLVDCTHVAIPRTFSGLQTVSMVEVGLRGGAPLSTWRAAGVLATGSTLYATADHAWLATSQWNEVRPLPSGAGSDAMVEGIFAPVPGRTAIHLFDTPLGAQPVYQASGRIDGTLLNQFAMDERNGVLRVASTTDGLGEPSAKIAPEGGAASEPAQLPASEGRVTTLKQDGDRLVRVGVLTGLGAGESIRGVRFDGDVAYVVTYRQTDPLFTVDLSDAARPRLRGELQMPGYSAYLHPAGPGRILGLGQNGTETGSVTGLQLSLFDVSRLDHPRRLDQRTLAGAWSDAESDHHAFTMTGNLVLVPYTGQVAAVRKPAAGLPPDTPPDMMRIENGVIAVRVGADSLGSPAKLRTSATPVRAVVHDGDVYTLTTEGVAVHAPTGTGFTRVTVARF